MTSCCEMILLYARRMLSAAGSIVEMYYFIADVFLSPCVRIGVIFMQAETNFQRQ